MKPVILFYFTFAVTCAHNLRLKPIPRIANGKIAKLKQFPYQVKLQIRSTYLMSSLCGGALISSKTILTAAHCLVDAKSMTIFMGITKVGIKESQITRDVGSKNFVIHKNYNATSIENDIALATFDDPVAFNDQVKPVKLPKPDQVNLVCTMAVVAGFGKIGSFGPTSKQLRFAKRRILPASDCQRRYKFNATVHICLDGSSGISICSGDSGSPLVVNDKNGSKIVVGIASFGSMWCDVGFPSVYTKVTTYLDWINRHMK